VATRLIIDTDPGVDDAFAIALAARSHDVELLAVTTVFGNVGLSETTLNARRVLALYQRDDVPVAAGAARPLVHPDPRPARHVHGHDGLSGRSAALPDPRREPEPVDAVTVLARTLERADGPVTIAAIGPLTNIAALLAAHPGAADRIDRVVVMGGSLGHGNTTAAAEFNVHCDPEAAQRVLTSGEVRCVLVPLELTHRCAVSTEWLATLAASGGTGAALEALTPDYLAHYRRALGWDGMVLHDAVAVAEAIVPGTLRADPLPLSVETSFGPARGATVVDRRRPAVIAAEGGPGAAAVPGTANTAVESTVAVTTDTDVDALRAWLLDRLTAGHR
jgi:pyrimidine-specific ribonucleoside hydrolase